MIKVSKKQVCKVSRCECGRINISDEDEEKHIRNTGHKTAERESKLNNSKLIHQIGIKILAIERNIELTL